MESICELVNIRKSYGEHVLFNDFNMAVKPGEMIAVMGKSGTGKSTILNLIGLLEKASHGEILLFGKKVPKIHSYQATLLRRNKISYLFQNFALIDGESVSANLEIPFIYSGKSLREKRKLKQEALEKIGLDVSLKQKIFSLSGGEQQRVAIARILLKPSDLILADEPTGSLDADNRQAILDILQTLNRKGKTIIIVTHDPIVASACKRTEQILNLTHSLTPSALS